MRTMKENETPSRRRNISWADRVDELAVALAFEKRFKGGVSELLARLVMAEAKRKRGIAHLHPAAPEKEGNHALTGGASAEGGQ